MIYKNIVIRITGVLFLFMFFSSCYSSEVSGELDMSLLPELEDLQKIMYDNRVQIFNMRKGETSFDEKHITQSEFYYAFRHLDEATQKRFYKLFQDNRIEQITYRAPCCIYFYVHSTYSDNIFQSSWENLVVCYENNCADLLCHTKMGRKDIPKDKITFLKEHWYKVIDKQEKKISRF